MEEQFSTLYNVPKPIATESMSSWIAKQHDYDDRYMRMENVAAGALQSPHINRCLVIAINVDQGHYPYSLISVFNKKIPTE